MTLWWFKDYWQTGDFCPFAEWYAAQNIPAQAAFDATVADLAQTENWIEPELSSFALFTDKPEDLGLAQVKFYVIQKSRKRQFRVIGIWREEQREFILLTGLEKSGRSPIPPNAFKLARELRIAFEENRGEIREHY